MSSLSYTETPAEFRLDRMLNYWGGEIAARSRRSADASLLEWETQKPEWLILFASYFLLFLTFRMKNYLFVTPSVRFMGPTQIKIQRKKKKDEYFWTQATLAWHGLTF